jgi:hypothetical protein
LRRDNSIELPSPGFFVRVKFSDHTSLGDRGTHELAIFTQKFFMASKRSIVKDEIEIELGPGDDTAISFVPDGGCIETSKKVQIIFL